MKDILIIAHFTQAPGEHGNGRFHYLAETIDKDKASVEVVTTTFAHAAKRQRQVDEAQLNSLSYGFTMLYEPGYQKNVSVKRLYSHHHMGRSLRHYLEKRKKPDLIYCAVPSLDVARNAALYAREQGIRFIIDIQDLWPEAFEMAFSVPPISDALFYPMRKEADYIYASANHIVAVSQTYANRALAVSDRCDKANVVFLGTDLTHFDRLAEENKLISKPDDEIWLAYIGTLGHSYDLNCVIDALALIGNKHKLRLVVMGDGPLRTKFEGYANRRGVSANFTGRLDYGKMVGLLTVCDLAVNPIARGSAATIINKHADYAAAGLPVLNTQECLEYRRLIEEYNAGLNCENNNPSDLADRLLCLCEDKSLRTMMGSNSRRLAVDKFDRRKTYRAIVNLLEE